MFCPYLIQLLSNGVYCRKNGGAETTCSPGVCLHCEAGGGVRAAWKLERMPPVGPPEPPQPQGPGFGPGTELRAIFADWGIAACAFCISYATQMDIWGLDECEKRFDGIVAHLEEEADKRPWTEKLSAAWAAKKLVLEGIFSQKSAIEWAVREAIRRAQEKEHASAPPTV